MIWGRTIGPGYPPFVIAEMSGNHNKSLDRALAIVDAAADAGAHAIKIQTYTADTLTFDVDRPELTIDDSRSLWADRSLYAEAYKPWEWHKPILERARGIAELLGLTPEWRVASQLPVTCTTGDRREGGSDPRHMPAPWRGQVQRGQVLCVRWLLRIPQTHDSSVSGCGSRDCV